MQNTRNDYKSIKYTDKKIDKILEKLKLKSSEKITKFTNKNIDRLNHITNKKNQDDYPEEYIEWVVEFFYKIFYIDEESLIPRFETEDLVRYAIVLSKSKKYDYMIDIWTWVWIIPISINLNSWNSSVKTFWLELVNSVLKTSEKNNEKHNTNVLFRESDLLDIFLKKDSNKKDKDTNLKSNSRVLITANLPYIAEGDEIWNDVLQYEPRTALFWWWKEWFKLYKKLFNQIIEFSEKYQVKELDFIFEIWDYQQDVAHKYLNKKKWLFDFCFKKDLNWVDRFIYWSLNIDLLKDSFEK